MVEVSKHALLGLDIMFSDMSRPLCGHAHWFTKKREKIEILGGDSYWCTHCRLFLIESVSPMIAF